MQNTLLVKKTGFIALLIFCATPYASAPLALAIGFLFSLLFGSPFPKLNGKLTGLLLKVSIVGLGFGINAANALTVSKQGFWLTFATITITLSVGYFVGRWLKADRKSSFLISSGTSICGGSAIAAVAPVVRASDESISTSLGVVFLLNAIALFVFPAIGHLLDLSQHQFGMWSAIAIHDTSSVVGASSAYGAEALSTAVTIKLARTLWIIPLSLFALFIFKPEDKKIKNPVFILFFIIAILIHSYTNIFAPIEEGVVQISKNLLVVTLFLIGANLSIAKIKAVGWRPLALGVILWVTISVFSLLAILNFY